MTEPHGEPPDYIGAQPTTGWRIFMLGVFVVVLVVTVAGMFVADVIVDFLDGLAPETPLIHPRPRPF